MQGQVWSTAADGGHMVALNLSKKLRMVSQPLQLHRQFCDGQSAVGRGKGDTFHWNVYSDVATPGGTLTETEVMPETKFTITQGTMTLQEYGNSVPYTGKLDDLSEQPVTAIIHKVLKHDASKALDRAAAAQFASSPLRMVGTSTIAFVLTTNGTATATNSAALNKTHLRLIAETMAERNIPTFENGDYYAIGRPFAFRQLRTDLESVSAYTETGFGRLVNGEMGRYEGVRFIRQTNIAQGVGSTVGSEWAGGNSDVVKFFGSDNVTEGIAIPEELRGKIPSDYGRSRGIAWYYLGGFALAHTAALNARVMVWDSAA